MHDVDQLIIELIVTGRQATENELHQIIAHVAQASFASRLVRVNQWLRQELEGRGLQISAIKLPSVELPLLKRINFDQQWPPGTTVDRFLADLHQAVQHPEVRVWTYRFLGEAFVGFLAPSHVQNAPNPEESIFVAYSADYGTIKTAFQASSPEAIFTSEFEGLTQHR